MNTLCSVENCYGEVNCKEFCKACYDKDRRKRLKTQLNEEKKKYYISNKVKTKNDVSKYMRTDSGRYKKASYNARRLGKVWKLTFEEYIKALGDRKCHYCPNPVSETGSGLDRKDNNRGYEIDNCVPCCYTCNTLKRNLLTYDEMLQVSKLLKQLRGKEDIWT